MSSALERLRRLQALRLQKSRPEPTYIPLDADGEEYPTPPQRERGSLEELAPGALVETPVGACYCVSTATPLASTRGPAALGSLLAVAPAVFAAYHPDFDLAAEGDFTRAAFIDTETTGLGGGAGVYAFMIGVGLFVGEPAPTHFVVRQFFMRHPGEEAAVLAAVAAACAGRTLTVTFNGRSFDLPLLRTRYLQNRRFLGPLRDQAALLQEGRPHLDLLFPARRLWRRRLQSCRLINLEQRILDLQRTEEDVPGALIPQLYLDYLRTGEGGAMRRVFYHNREDILSMVALAQELGRVYAAPGSAELALPGDDWLSLAALRERQGDLAGAEAAYLRSLDALNGGGRSAEAFAGLGALLKRAGRWAEAASVWERWLTTLPGVDVTPYVELAKCCEWQLNDLENAEMWTAWALHNLEQLPPAQRSLGQVYDLQRRLMRIRRKRQAS